MWNLGSKKKKILISAYAISPHLGSEYGVGWNFVTRLSDFYHITVLYGTSGGRMGNNMEMEEYIENNKCSEIEYVHVKPNFIVYFLDWMNRKINPIFFSYSYMLWQRQVLAMAEKLNNNNNYDLVHHLNTIGFRQPGLLWKMKIPFVWGPVGGSSNLNKIFFPSQGRANYVRHIIRNYSNWYFLKFSARVRNASRVASAIFCATRADQENFKKYLKIDCSVIRENSIINYASGIKKTGSVVKFVWVGSVDDRKALHFLLNALAKLRYQTGWILHVVGDGPSKQRCMDMGQKLGLSDKIIWHGSVERKAVLEIMREADVHVITSIMDSNPTVLLEALEMCIPTIAFDHFGMRDLIESDIGFKIKITTLSDIVEKLSESIDFCISHHDVLDRMKYRILEKQNELHWDITIEKVRELYERVLTND